MTSLLAATVLAASTVRTIGAIIAVLAVLVVIVFAVVNVRSGRAEAGSEIELAPNRRPYYDDEELEGRRLDRALGAGLVTMGVIALGLPLYWLAEPSRQEGAVATFDHEFEVWGEDLYDEGAQCGACHGPDGVGGVAPFTLLDDENEFVAQVSWLAPALDTVLLRHSDEEVLEILIYGRPGSPMPAWGEAGGGPLTTQQLDSLLAYMRSITLTADEARAQIEGELRSTLDLGEDDAIDWDDLEVGEALFNLGRTTGYAGGGYSCGRCHTRGWSISPDSVQPAGAPGVEQFIDHPDGSGAFGFNLRNPLIPRQFLTVEEMVEFIIAGSERGQGYGQVGQGSGRMPGFGANPNTDDEDDGMMTEDMIRAIVAYVNSLADEDAGETDDETDDEAEV
jgi:mono/diheme cytochrome c family protein